MLQVHYLNDGERTSKQLSFLKIPCLENFKSEGYRSNFFRGFFIIHLQGGKDFFIAFPGGFEEIDIFIKLGLRRSGNFLGRQGSFSVANVLRTRSGRHGVIGMRGVTGGGIVASLATVKTTAFSNTSGMFCGGEL